MKKREQNEQLSFHFHNNLNVINADTKAVGTYWVTN